jgi:hypothetical protein
MKGTDMTAPQKMKYIAEQWKKSKLGSSSQEKTAGSRDANNKEKPKKEMQKKTQPKKHSNEILNMLGIDVKKSKAKPKSEHAVKKVVKAMEKMTIPVEEKMTEIPKHPIHLLEKEEVKHKKMFDDEDDIGF